MHSTTEYISEMFERNYNDMYHPRNNDYKIYLNKPKTDFMMKSFSYLGASASNNLQNRDGKGYKPTRNF